ncbi:MAG: extracellular solute-binding protein, partial [Anaerolineales bacterium]
MNKKLFIFCSILLITAFALTACGPATTEAPPATEAPATEAPATEMPATEAPATEAPATEMPATEAPVGGVIEVEDGASIVFSGWGDETEQQIYRDSIERFNALYPGVTVDYQPIPADFQTKLKAAMAGGTAPDVFYVDDQLMTAFGTTG